MTAWKKVKIPEVLFFQEGPGVRKFQFRNKGIKLLNGGNINNNKLDLSSTKLFLDNKEATGKYKHFLVDEGDLVIASSGVLVNNFHNKIAFVGKEHLPLCMNTSTIRFRSLDNRVLDLRYFKFFLQSKNFTGQLKRLITGSAQLNFGPSHLKQIDVLLPEIQDQLHISSILSKAESLISQRKESLRLLDELLKSTFLEMFGDPVRNEKGWKKKTIEELVINEKYSIKRGPFGGALKKEIFVSDGYLVYEQFHALNNDFNFGRYYIDDKKFKELKDFEVKPGDIIVSCSGVYLGKLAIVPEGAKKGIINQALLKLSLNPRIVKSIFFLYLFRHDSFTHHFFGKTRGSGIPNFPPMDQFKRFKFISPPIELQSKFAQSVARTETLKAQYQASLRELVNLYGALSQRAFRGELNLKQR